MNEKKPFYKKWWVWVIAVFVLILIISIGKGEDKAKKVGDQPTNVNQASENKSETFKIGDKVKLGEYTLVVNKASKCVSTNQFIKPGDGKKFISIDVSQENNGSDPVSYNLFNFKLQDNKDYSYQPSIMGCEEPSFGSGALQNGQTTRGYITFEIPIDNTQTKLVFTPTFISTKQIIINLE
jgi:hypothetical protein